MYIKSTVLQYFRILLSLAFSHVSLSSEILLILNIINSRNFIFVSLMKLNSIQNLHEQKSLNVHTVFEYLDRVILFFFSSSCVPYIL